jgi:hypothetical protein
MRALGQPTERTSASAMRIEIAWLELGRPPMISGHLHQAIRYGSCLVLPYLGRSVWPVDPIWSRPGDSAPLATPF